MVFDSEMWHPNSRFSSYLINLPLSCTASDHAELNCVIVYATRDKKGEVCVSILVSLEGRARNLLVHGGSDIQKADEYSMRLETTSGVTRMLAKDGCRFILWKASYVSLSVSLPSTTFKWFILIWNDERLMVSSSSPSSPFYPPMYPISIPQPT